jgi:stringent starvation protein B
MKTTRLEEKKVRLANCLDRGVTQIHLDARRAGVIVPEAFRAQHQLVLNVSYRYDPPDLTVSDWGVRQTLSFQGTRFTVGVPWGALFAIGSDVTQEFFMYPDDMPPELLVGVVEKIKALDEAKERPAPDAGPRAVLRQVVLASADGPTAAPPELATAEKSPEPSPESPANRRSHLRVVK